MLSTPRGGILKRYNACPIRSNFPAQGMALVFKGTGRKILSHSRHLERLPSTSGPPDKRTFVSETVGIP
jgi:hypothetical protein